MGIAFTQAMMNLHLTGKIRDIRVINSYWNRCKKCWSFQQSWSFLSDRAQNSQ